MLTLVPTLNVNGLLSGSSFLIGSILIIKAVNTALIKNY